MKTVNPVASDLLENGKRSLWWDTGHFGLTDIVVRIAMGSRMVKARGRVGVGLGMALPESILVRLASRQFSDLSTLIALINVNFGVPVASEDYNYCCHYVFKLHDRILLLLWCYSIDERVILEPPVCSLLKPPNASKVFRFWKTILSSAPSRLPLHLPLHL